jgi:hypothetical protein
LAQAERQPRRAAIHPFWQYLPQEAGPAGIPVSPVTQGAAVVVAVGGSQASTLREAQGTPHQHHLRKVQTEEAGLSLLAGLAVVAVALRALVARYRGLPLAMVVVELQA